MNVPFHLFCFSLCQKATILVKKQKNDYQNYGFVAIIFEPETLES